MVPISAAIELPTVAALGGAHRPLRGAVGQYVGVDIFEFRRIVNQVQKGETLFSISRRFGVKVQDLMAANGINKAENLQIGQTLKVPQD